MENALKIEKLSKEYPGRLALKDVTFSVKKGSVHGFLGPNGAGKSTTMKIIAGLVQKSSGEIHVDGKIGFLPEHPPVYSNMSVEDYLAFVFDIYSDKTQTKKEAIEEVLKKTGLTHVKERLIGNLSKGYQQRVGIAQAIIHSPEIIILDEPTVGLDPVAIGEIRNLIQELKKDHTVLFSSHQLYEVELLCSDITLINNGEIVVTGTIDEILKNLKSSYEISLKLKNFNAEIQKELIKEFSLKDLSFKKIENEDAFLVRAIFNDKQDKRSLFARAVVEKNCELLEMVEIKGELEDLFKRI